MNHQCPDNTIPIKELEEFDTYLNYHISWDIKEEAGKQCRIIFKASSYINGKIKLEIVQFNYIKGVIYLMPNTYNTELENYGIVENYKVYSIDEPRRTVYQFPSDWTAYLQYDTLYEQAGELEVRAVALKYEESDYEQIINEFEPTGTFLEGHETMAVDEDDERYEQWRMARTIEENRSEKLENGLESLDLSNDIDTLNQKYAAEGAT